ncbi:hypothetical protein BJV78DRAFT_359134 [Lactifluus subvellereus]|nr:hypothetical protein BJV78DRAFT_359134 [Lactifluus subvellereus]
MPFRRCFTSSSEGVREWHLRRLDESPSSSRDLRVHGGPGRKTGRSPDTRQYPGASLTAATDVLPRRTRTATSFAPSVALAVSPVIVGTPRSPRMFRSCRLLHPRGARRAFACVFRTLRVPACERYSCYSRPFGE